MVIRTVYALPVLDPWWMMLVGVGDEEDHDGDLLWKQEVVLFLNYFGSSV